MCITFFRVAPGSPLPFVIAFNRDEMIQRDAEPAQFQEARGFPHILCGFDLQANVTWFAINTFTGDFACVTNHRTLSNWVDKKYESRGKLVLGYVKLNDPSIKEKEFRDLSEFHEALDTKTYKGFNLVFGNVFSGEFFYKHHHNDD